jgi:hypothetical protein
MEGPFCAIDLKPWSNIYLIFASHLLNCVNLTGSQNLPDHPPCIDSLEYLDELPGEGQPGLLHDSICTSMTYIYTGMDLLHLDKCQPIVLVSMRRLGILGSLRSGI